MTISHEDQDLDQANASGLTRRSATWRARRLLPAHARRGPRCFGRALALRRCSCEHWSRWCSCRWPLRPSVSLFLTKLVAKLVLK